MSLKLVVTKDAKEMFYRDGKLVSAASVSEEEKKQLRQDYTSKDGGVLEELEERHPNYRWTVREADGLTKVRAYHMVTRKRRNGDDVEVEEQFLAHAADPSVFSVDRITQKVETLEEEQQAKKLKEKYGL